ncbi:MAG: sensor histidine kinase [Planctomycetota bacterium]|jgi:PAS domain S-box-containing protein
MTRAKAKNTEGRTRKNAVLWRTWLLIGFMAAVMFGSMSYIFYIGNDTIATHGPLVDTSMEFRLECTMAHVRCEEVISGSSQSDIDAIWKHLSNADWYARAMLEGGHGAQGTFLPLDELEMRRTVEEALVELANFKTVTEKRLAEAGTVSAETEQTYHATFDNLMGKFDSVETALQQVIWRDLKNFRILQTVLIIVCLLLAVVVGVVISRFIQRPINNELKLQAANQQLRASEQQLRAANRELIASEQQLRAANQQLGANEKKLREQYEFFRTAVESLSHPFVVIDTHDFAIKVANSAATHTPGTHGVTCYELLHKRKEPCDETEHPCPIRRIQETKRAVTVEHVHYDKDGNPRDVEVHAYPIFDDKGDVSQMIEYCLDITDRKRAEQQLKTSLEEKGVLLREIHHRVKNNLQIIVSLLSLQSDYVQDKWAVELFHECQLRVKSMALLHERLYQTENLAQINLADYVRDLTDELLCSYGADPRKIELKINVKDVFPTIDIAIPCALMINELVSNCLKHAFPGDRAGEIRIGLDSDEQDNCTLSVSDDGVGFAQDGELPNVRTLGLQLVSILAEQLRGTVILDKSAGTSFRISFPGQ